MNFQYQFKALNKYAVIGWMKVMSQAEIRC